MPIIVHLFILSRWHMAKRRQQTPIIEPVHPFQRRIFHLINGSWYKIGERVNVFGCCWKCQMVPGAGLEPARSCPRGILSPLCLPIPPPGQEVDKIKGWGRNRTGVHGFAGRCITTLPPSRNKAHHTKKAETELGINEEARKAHSWVTSFQGLPGLVPGAS